MSYASKIEELIVQRDALRDELDALRKDAERYRWLRNKANYARKSDPAVYAGAGDSLRILDGEELDESVDAAMSGEGKAA